MDSILCQMKDDIETLQACVQQARKSCKFTSHFSSVIKLKGRSLLAPAKLDAEEMKSWKEKAVLNERRAYTNNTSIILDKIHEIIDRFQPAFPIQESLSSSNSNETSQTCYTDFESTFSQLNAMLQKFIIESSDCLSSSSSQNRERNKDGNSLPCQNNYPSSSTTANNSNSSSDLECDDVSSTNTAHATRVIHPTSSTLKESKSPNAEDNSSLSRSSSTISLQRMKRPLSFTLDKPSSTFILFSQGENSALKEKYTTYEIHKFNKLAAIYKGKITRSLYQTQKIQDSLRIIRETKKILKELSPDLEVNKFDKELKDRLKTQLKATRASVYNIFLNMSASQQQQIIHNDNKIREEKKRKREDEERKKEVLRRYLSTSKSPIKTQQSKSKTLPHAKNYERVSSLHSTTLLNRHRENNADEDGNFSLLPKSKSPNRPKIPSEFYSSPPLPTNRKIKV